jgi:DNA-binding transcriptional MocR family regulator
VTHQKLADDVGSVREVVSRILAQWAEAGLIEALPNQPSRKAQFASASKMDTGTPPVTVALRPPSGRPQGDGDWRRAGVHF